MPRKKVRTRGLSPSLKSASNKLAATGERFDQARAEFLKVDVQTSLTFSGIALESEQDSEKQRRNQMHARRGYDTIVRLARNTPLTPADKTFMSNRLKRLKSELQQLGENF